MATVRTNLVEDPRYIGPESTTGTGTASWTQVDNPSTSSPDGRPGWTQFTATSDQVGGIQVGVDEVSPATPGEVYTGSLFATSSRKGLSFIARLVWRDAAKATISFDEAPAVIEAGTAAWDRLSVTGVAPAGTAYVQVLLVIPGNTGTIILTGDRLSVSCRMIEPTDTLGTYFDGSYEDTKAWAFAWTDGPNASTSTATYLLPSIVATVLKSSTEPPPIQLTINDVPDGQTYAVEGISPGDRTWQVARGHGVSEGVQIVLIDNRAPVNVPVRYRLVTPTGAYDSNTVTRLWAPANGDSKFLVQSLDGRIVVPIAAWLDNQLPKQPELRTAGFPIRGRRRPVMVLAVAGEGTMNVLWRLDRVASRQLDEIIAAGGGIALITDGTARDLPVSDTAVITSASSALWEADNGVSTDRVWELELTWIDDPEPSTIPVEWDVGEVDALLFGKTVAEVDAQFAGMTVAAVDAQDWGTVSGSPS